MKDLVSFIINKNGKIFFNKENNNKNIWKFRSDVSDIIYDFGKREKEEAIEIICRRLDYEGGLPAEEIPIEFLDALCCWIEEHISEIQNIVEKEWKKMGGVFIR